MEERVVPVRLQKFLARAGVASRRGSEDLMTAGRVTVNGVPVSELGAKVMPGEDVVRVDGVEVTYGAPAVVLMLNKPIGYVTTMNDPQGRAAVSQLVPVKDYPGLFPIGRLDRETSGLLLFSTDGDLGHLILHPKNDIPKSYVARVDGHLSTQDAGLIARGIRLDDGMTKPAEVTILDSPKDSTMVRITITEGRKRQVRRMFSEVSHPVIELHRDTVGPIVLGALPEGQWRLLSDAEITRLRDFAAGCVTT